MAYTAAELKLLNTLALQGATAIENARLFERTVQAAHERERLMALHQAAEIARAKLESELDAGARIQANLFPASCRRSPATSWRPGTAPPGVVAATTTTRSTCRRRERRLPVCVADVAGKGLPAALVMSNMQATLRALLGRPSRSRAGRHASEPALCDPRRRRST